jgi:hypothetical protein
MCLEAVGCKRARIITGFNRAQQASGAGRLHYFIKAVISRFTVEFRRILLLHEIDRSHSLYAMLQRNGTSAHKRAGGDERDGGGAKSF